MAASSNSGEYWIIAVPNEGKTQESVVEQQRKNLQKYCDVKPFKMPQLRISAVDELMKLNETLAKFDIFGHQVLTKLVRSYREYTDKPTAMPTVKDQQLRNYIPNFEWENGRNQYKSKLTQLTADIQDRLVTANDRLKGMVEKYKQVKQKLSNDERETDGNLQVVKLQKYVKPTDYITGEYITTALVVVSKQKQAEFLSRYWRLDETEEAHNMWRRKQKEKLQLIARAEEETARLAEREAQREGEDEEDKKPVANETKKSAKKKRIDTSDLVMTEQDREELRVVCPGSAVELANEGEFLLYKVVLLKKGMDWFKAICRDFRYNVRDFEYKSPEEIESEAVERKKLTKEEADKRRRLTLFCQNYFPEVLSDWLHLKMIRVFSEAILRYGPPPDNLVTTILTVNPNRGPILNNVLSEMYKHLSSSDMGSNNGEEEGAMAMMGMFELRPYVFIPMMVGFD